MEDNQITDNDKEDDKQDRIELVQRAVEGDKEAFTNLYMLTYSEVYHIVKVFIHNEDTAQDIVQETYYKSLRKIKQLKEPDKFPVWIKKIAVNTAKAHLRKVDWVLFSEADGEGGKSIAELQDERLEHIPEIVVDQAETKELIDQILGELDEKQRMVVGMFYYEQMSVNEIAEALNCSVNTVKSRLNYARKKIGKEIAELEKKGVILLGKRAECEVIVTGEEDVVEYSYDTEYAKYLFDEVNKMRTANGVEPFVWNEEDAVYASKVKVGMHVQPDFDIYGIIGVDENEETQDVQLVYGDDKDFTKEAALDALIQNSSCMIQLMKKTDQPLTAGCAVLVLKVDGKIEKRGLIFTIGPSESELANYSQQEREVYWANWMGISVDDMKKYLH